MVWFVKMGAFTGVMGNCLPNSISECNYLIEYVVLLRVLRI